MPCAYSLLARWGGSGGAIVIGQNGCNGSKSVHMRFVHSRCELGLLLGGYVLDGRCDRMCIIEMGKFVLPWSILLYVLLDVRHEIAKAFPFVVPGTLVVHIAERPFNRVGTRTVRR